MALAPFDTFCAEEADRFEVRRWVVPAIVLSLVFHAGLVVAFQYKDVESFPVVHAPPRTPTMVIWRLADPPKFPEEEESKVTPVAVPIVVQPLAVPADRPGDVAGDPVAQLVGRALPLADVPTGNERPEDSPQPGTGTNSSAAARWNAVTNGIAGRALEDNGNTMAKAPAALAETLGMSGSLSVAGRRSLDEALSRLEPVAPGDAPIEIPGGRCSNTTAMNCGPRRWSRCGSLAT